MINVVLNHPETILNFNQDEFYTVTLDSEDKLKLQFVVEANVHCSLLVQCQKAKAVELQIKLQQGSQCTLFFWNSAVESILFNDVAHVKKNAALTLAYGELSSGDFVRNSVIHLDEEGASVHLQSATLSAGNKNYTMSCEHHARNTTSMIKNDFVLLKEGSCRMDAIGKIDHGASGSKSHQSSRGLTFDQQKRAIILPQLLIDENDVEASHATTLGQIDENQMYYLQSRGLSKQEAIELITYGYLLPIADLLQEEALKEHFIQEIEMKVSQSCSL